MSFMIYHKNDNPVFPTNNSEASVEFMLGLINSLGRPQTLNKPGLERKFQPFFLFGPWFFIDGGVYQQQMNMPQYHDIMIPTIKAIDELGGSGTIQDIAEGVIQLLDLPEEVTSDPHNPEKSSQTEVEYPLAWARTYLKKVGLIENSERGVWSFTENYHRGMKLDSEEIVQTVRGLSKNSKKKVNARMVEEVEVDS